MILTSACDVFPFLGERERTRASESRGFNPNCLESTSYYLALPSTVGVKSFRCQHNGSTKLADSFQLYCSRTLKSHFNVSLVPRRILYGDNTVLFCLERRILVFFSLTSGNYSSPSSPYALLRNRLSKIIYVASSIINSI